jgi:outer membrane protein assembly factor BamB
MAHLVLAAFLLAPGRLPAGDQPQWGQRYSRNMVSAERGLPESFDVATGRNVKWKAALGTETYSTPVVGSGRVLIGTNNGQPRDPRQRGDRAVLMCFDEEDGRFLWQLAVPKLTKSIYWDWPHAGMCSTATIEGERVYVVSNRGEVLCLDLNGQANGNDGPFVDEARHGVPADASPVESSPTDGDIVWLFDMITTCGVRQHDSAHSSILVHGGFLYVNTSNGVDDSHRRIEAPDAPSLIVLEKSTGRLVARDDEHIGPRIFHSTWSSPALGEVGGRPVVFFCGGDGVVYGFEALASAPPTGEVLKLRKVWQFDCDPGAPKENVHQYNSNRQVSPSNIKSIPVFVDGRLYVTAGGDLWWGKNEAWLKCIDANGSGDCTKTAGVWSSPLERHCMSTPSVQDGLVFVADCGGHVHCVDARTGETCWTHDAKGEIWSSTLVADGRVYVGTRRGDFWVLGARREKQVLAQLELDSPLHGSPVAANGVLYLATMKFLYAIQAPPPS